MASYNVNVGEAVHGAIRFRPKGQLRCYATPTQANPVERIGAGGLAARFFVGLHVGMRKAHSVDDVVRIVRRVRKAQGHEADASILAQNGIFEDKKGRDVIEASVQVILIDFAGLKKAEFVREMTDLGEELREELQQEKVILEIQRRGIVTDVFSIVP